MTDKYRSDNTITPFLDNDLIDNNYDHIVQDKITKEFLNSKCCDNCDEYKPGEEVNLNAEGDIVLAKCKGLLGLHFCENRSNIPLKLNDNIVIKFNNEFEFATVIETGRIVQFRKNKSDDENSIPVIERVATDIDIEKNISNSDNTIEAKTTFLTLIQELSLDMKLVDIHFQFDRKKLFFFYTSSGRVDFRELAKRLASKYKTRIELRQIGVRDEAKRIGGIATCGREYCCTSFLSSFKRITTDIAVENNISTSISKYTGPCGKLKCCLSFEIE